MKKFFAYLMIIIGTLIATAGLLGTPFVQDYFPIDFMLPTDDQARHHFLRLRMVPTEPHALGYLPYVVLLLGFMTLIVGLILRRKFRGLAA